MAQEINPSWYIQPSVVGMKADSEFGVGDKDFGGGLKFGKPVSQLFDIQFGGTYVRADDNGSKYKQTTLGIDTLLMFSRSNFRPFLLLGIGAERDKTNGRVNASQTSPYVTAGLGFQAQLSDRWAVQADYRTVQGRLKDDNSYGFSRSNNKYVTVGFNYAFNAPPVAQLQRHTSLQHQSSSQKHQLLHQHRLQLQHRSQRRKKCRSLLKPCSTSTKLSSNQTAKLLWTK